MALQDASRAMMTSPKWAPMVQKMACPCVPAGRRGARILPSPRRDVLPGALGAAKVAQIALMLPGEARPSRRVEIMLVAQQVQARGMRVL